MNSIALPSGKSRVRPNRADLLRPCATLALVYAVLAIAVTLGLAISFFGREELESIMWFGSLAGLTGLLIIWLQLIRRTLRNFLGTGSATAAVLVHLLLWQPVWDIGCFNDVIITGQGIALMGLWMWFVPLVWWGGSVMADRRSSNASTQSQEIQPMTTRSIAYMRAVALVPLVSGLWVVTFMTIAEWTNSEQAGWTTANLLGGVFTAAGWVWAWRGRVTFTPTTRAGTLGLALALIVVCGASAFISSGPAWIDSMSLTLPLLAAGAYMIGTAWIWRECADLGMTFDRPYPLCPQCGYNMTGLTQARCPECGQSYTLDRLFAANLATD